MDVVHIHRNSKLKEQAIQVLRDLLASHDSDSRYNSSESRGSIASIYLPLLSVVMDNYQHLYKGADGWEDWATTFERNSGVRRSVVIRDNVDSGPIGENVSFILFSLVLKLISFVGSFKYGDFLGAAAWTCFYTKPANMFFMGFEKCG